MGLAPCYASILRGILPTFFSKREAFMGLRSTSQELIDLRRGSKVQNRNKTETPIP